jgi:TrmH family RNA methyltransferase
VITSRRNPRIVDIRKLEQRKQRQQQGLFRVEGLQLLHMALDAGARPRTVVYCESLFVGAEAPRLLRRFEQVGAELLPAAPEVMESLSSREVCQGLVATFPLPSTPLSALQPAPDDLVVVLDRLQDPGNVGTLIRTADAVGAAGVVLIEPTADPFDPKTVRGSMGSVFNLPIVLTADAGGALTHLSGCGLRTVGADVRAGVPWGDEVLAGGVALVLGNEARGLDADLRDHVAAWVRLPMIGRAESLNVAVAGGVLMYGWLRQRLRAEQERGREPRRGA